MHIMVVCMHIGVVCMHIGVVCMHIGVVCMHIGVVCMHMGVVCMHMGVVCMHMGVVCMPWEWCVYAYTCMHTMCTCLCRAKEQRASTGKRRAESNGEVVTHSLRL